MPAFNKSNPLPPSSQSSVDSLVTRPSTSTSASNAGLSQGSGASSYGDTYSPEQSVGSFTGKRHSVFTLRSRSNTATSTTSSFSSSLSPPRMGGHDGSSHRSLFRGKKAKRTSGSFSPYMSHDQEESQVASKRTSVLRKAKRQVDASEGSGELIYVWGSCNFLTFAGQSLKHRISSPFDFQHLTHTDRHQFAALQDASGKDLVAGFQAVSASQAPRKDLKGIKAEALHFQNFSSENLENPAQRSASALDFMPDQDLVEPAAAYQEPLPSQADATRPFLRQTRSVESFSRPGVSSRMHRHTQSANPPPRALSRASVTEGESQEQQPSPATIRLHRQSNVWDQFAPLSPTRGGHLPTMEEEPDSVGHALTTPDNSAIHPFTPCFSPGLEDVAEEPERFSSPRPAPQPPVMAARSPRSSSPDYFAFNTHSTIARSQSRKSSCTSPKSSSQKQGSSRPTSQMSDTLGSPGLSRKHSIKRTSTVRRKSNTWRVIEESWEDDIDYIYDNALEAECDFDWGQASEQTFEARNRSDIVERDHRRESTIASHPSLAPSLMRNEEPASSPELYAGAFRPSLLVPSTINVPELEMRSAVSTSTADTGVHTPSDFFSHLVSQRNPFSEVDDYGLLDSQEYKDHVSREEMYEDILADYEGSEKHFPLLDASRSIASSARSSHTRASKRSSYDSSMVSSGHGSGSWVAGIRRSASSSGSLPELVHSSRVVRRDMSVIVDQLTEQVASLSTTEDDYNEREEDDDVTPPGRASHAQTFFASDENQLSESKETSIDAEVKTSLELARRGSNRSTRISTYQHKYASSDGAAKMLASPKSAPRSRVASSSVPPPKREQYFSLFPSPPTHTAAFKPASRSTKQ